MTPTAYSANAEVEYIKAPVTFVWLRGESLAFISGGIVANTMGTIAIR